ncbi:vomeronasal type-1 receptor 4-like [Hippopotamus amphibius kiboko]|uniref:vomeronasal type-1 receptor 4-like n=1 Tax=Hippopotamus amphibius kiboko TaxID=575201 RepID=UPI0025929845|nr:vomeronasal type-1 receptor 4-like [Hippopotamus amphibius kiboko]
MSFHKDALRITSQAALKTTYLIQIGVGSLANVILFFHNISPVLLGHKQRPTHTILAHMAVANLLLLLSSGIPHTLAFFVSRNPLSSLGCQLVNYIHRMARSTTLCCTCVLSTYQSFTLIRRRPEWRMLRRAPRHTGFSCCTCWIVSVLMYTCVPVTLTGPQDMRNHTDTQGKWFCTALDDKLGFTFLWSISDAVLIGLMVWSSGCTVLLLRRHHQRMQCVRTPAGHHKCSPETRAAHTILMLVVTFVIFYVLNYSFVFHITVSLDFRLWLLQASNVLVSYFPTVSPFLLLLRDPRTLRLCS